MQIAVCEDDIQDRAEIRQIINELREKLALQCTVSYYTSGEELLFSIRRGSTFDLLILDIYLDGKNGIDTAKEGKMLLPETQTAFLTNSRDYAVDAFELDAIHYLQKPITKEKVEILFERFFKRNDLPVKLVELVTDREVYPFPLHRIKKITSCNKGIAVHLSGTAFPQHVPISFAKAELQLTDEQLIKITRGLIVHMDYILYMGTYDCKFKDGTIALLSRPHRIQIREKYNDYMFRSMKKVNFK